MNKIIVLTATEKILYKPISCSQLRYPHSRGFDNELVEAAVIFRSPDQKLVDPFLSRKSIELFQCHRDPFVVWHM